MMVAVIDREKPMRAMTKSQLAKAAGVSRWTLRRWLEDPYMREYSEIGDLVTRKTNAMAMAKS